MIDIESVTFRNFLSYGDYDTSIPISKLGPCLITGKNGAGKSTIINAMLYAIFGRTMHTPKPGDRILPRRIGKNGMCSIKFKNGDTITRTRKLAGHNELVVDRNGESILTTISTTPNQQAALNKMYDLDWQTFRSSAFFTQYGSAWMEMPDPQRKKEIERAMRVDRYTMYATVAKEKLDQSNSEQAKICARRDAIDQQVVSLQDDLAEATSAEGNFVTDKTRRMQAAIDQAREYKTQYDAIVDPDIEKLQQRWVKVEEARVMVRSLEKQANTLSVNADISLSRVREADRKIKLWTDKVGKVCMECRQGIPHTHVQTEIKPYEDERDNEKATAESLKQNIAKLQGKIKAAHETITASQPTMTVKEAQSIITRKNSLIDAAKKWAASAQKIKDESNPHTTTIDRLNDKIAERIAERDAINIDVERLDVIIKHHSYLFRAYNDRKRIKSFSVAKFRPFLNSRLGYYLDKFKLGIKVELTDSLTIDTDASDYEFMSGGERKRLDVALLLARYDVREVFFGRPSNVIVLDEVDSRMDEIGVECLIDIVLNDLAHREGIDAIITISHRASMRDVFPCQIAVENRDGFSVINDISGLAA